MIVNYLILAHKNVVQLNKLIDKLLMGGGGNVFVHLDKKWAINQSEYDSLVRDRVYIIPERISCKLDDWSLIEATLLLIKSAVKLTPDIPAYYYLLSGQDYPIKPIPKLENLLREKYPNPFIDCDKYNKDNWLFYKFRSSLFNNAIKIKSKYVRQSLMVVSLLIEKLYKPIQLSEIFRKQNISIYGGSAWWCLPDKIIVQILKEFEFNQGTIQLLHKIRTPEEIVFQILTMRTDLAQMVDVKPHGKGGQNCLTYANFFTPAKPPANHPYIITLEEKDFVLNKGNYLARKFDMTIDSEIIDWIDNHILDNPQI